MWLYYTRYHSDSLYKSLSNTLTSIEANARTKLYSHGNGNDSQRTRRMKHGYALPRLLLTILDLYNNNIYMVVTVNVLTLSATNSTNYRGKC